MNPTISATDFTQLVKAGTAPHVIDVRRPDEFAEVHVKSARLFPLDELQPAKVVQTIAAPATEPIYILCKSGMRAGKAADKFRSAGITNICVVEGGTEACVAAGAPLGDR
jgi:rhodanese-related sulfurtransferase